MSSQGPLSPHIRLWKAFHYSWAGICAAFRTEQAFRQEVYLSAIIIPLGLYLGQTGTEKALLVGVWLLVMIAEILNTAIERAIDRISFERHDLSKEAKDMASAAVMGMITLAMIVWALVLFF